MEEISLYVLYGLAGWLCVGFPASVIVASALISWQLYTERKSRSKRRSGL